MQEYIAISTLNDFIFCPYSIYLHNVERYHLMGKIDVYRKKEKMLIERKYQLKQIYQGQIYQLWGQMFCLQEMGIEQFGEFIHQFNSFNPANEININPKRMYKRITDALCE